MVAETLPGATLRPLALHFAGTISENVNVVKPQVDLASEFLLEFFDAPFCDPGPDAEHVGKVIDSHAVIHVLGLW
jgi:hypothetical protein